jgi:riboflavin synthase
MFTGIVQEIGSVRVVHQTGTGWQLEINAQKSLEGLAAGDSISINGVCQTVIALHPAYFVADVSPETRRVSTLGSFKRGKKVNLEKALTLTTPLGGHLVQGHVDSIGRITSIREQGNASVFEISFAGEFRKYVAQKGSICVDGISLTVAECTQTTFKISVIPHTIKTTTLQFNRISDPVNIEFDIIAKYVETLARFGESGKHTGELNAVYLKQRGF